jgi:UDP-N-acetylmuramyl pentapeptide phosphotransferase/UDP-N-acetylglucosamine-1-phosphate transferase
MAASEAFDRHRKWLVALAVVLGIVLIVIAVIYWVEPADSLPSFFPGHEAGSDHHHVKHGIAAFLVGLACLAFAWFNTGPKKRAAETTDTG